jgi:hypothetical protein
MRLREELLLPSINRKNITVTKVDAAKIGFMKVGEGGLKVRWYCTECGTILFNVRCFFRFHVHTCTSYLFFRLLPGMFDIFNTISHLLRK